MPFGDPKVEFPGIAYDEKRRCQRRPRFRLTLGEWLMSTYCESGDVCALVSSPSKRMDLQSEEVEHQCTKIGRDPRVTHNSVCLVAKSKTTIRFMVLADV